jgi:hypothetical protein
VYRRIDSVTSSQLHVEVAPLESNVIPPQREQLPLYQSMAGTSFAEKTTIPSPTSRGAYRMMAT